MHRFGVLNEGKEVAPLRRAVRAIKNGLWSWPWVDGLWGALVRSFRHLMEGLETKKRGPRRANWYF